ncbi:MAG: FAD-dependent oxidoreductase [Oscillospiraceae bacterium]|jgi:formate dehydrogenase major subunit|nr:FAD-dependent oxidoreductase [Oscillospiraceae bacterium]
MSEIKLTINEIEVFAVEGKTILGIAQELGIEIPALCHDERLEAFGSCGICTVEIEGSPRLFRACSTPAADGMVVFTDTARVRRNRKAALELLLSDHAGDCRPPCMLACPAETDCQGYIKHIASGDYNKAYELIMETNPFPASIGRVCPHPCEDRCRRELAEEPIAIAALKQYAADDFCGTDLPGTSFEAESTGKVISVIGGGPGGLSSAYFLRMKGHDVTVYDAMPKMGGMLRYGIPEYRLPERVLEKEIDEKFKWMQVNFRNNVRVGDDITLDELREKYDAVIVAAGAWTSTVMRCKGEDSNDVFGGIDFLRDIAEGRVREGFTGSKFAVVGGGNTAMDACRTAVRLGAEKVYNIYRRTRDEMPAEEIEIAEAEEEGVIFKFLTNPVEIIEENGNVKAVRLQLTELGEPDASGRRAPVPIEGKEEILEVDYVISAIGQKLNPKGFEALELTKWGTIIADPHTFCTNLQGVYAVGDAVNDGAGIAITAIGHAKKAAEAVHGFLTGGEVPGAAQYLSKAEKTSADFADEPKKPRTKMPYRCASERRGDFSEINLGLPEEAARNEALRCLECGCPDYDNCKLIRYANQYGVKSEKYNGTVHSRSINNDIPDVAQNPDKCILCGLCVRICEEEGAGVLGFIGRGFDTEVQAAGDLSQCRICGGTSSVRKCAEICPTGALMVISNLK